eukprot:3443399-Prymnesium_polylepis.2
MKQWREKAIEPPRTIVKERWEQIELNGKRVIVHKTATHEVVEELYSALKELDPAYDRKYSAMSDLKKMPVLATLLNDSKHCTNFSYLFELYSCGDPGCKFGCQVWPAVEEGSAAAAFQAELKRRTPLPRLAKDVEHFKSYAECCMLADNNECDLPSAKESLPKLLLKKMKALDHEKKKIFVLSKMRDVIICSECGRPRLIYSMQKPKKKLLDALDAYKEGVDYVCGGPLFDEEEVTEGDATLKDLSTTLHIKRIHTCRDNVESSYFNYSNVRG